MNLAMAPKERMAFKRHFVKNSRKKNLLIINCLSAGLLFLLANKGKKNFWSNPWFWGILSPKYRKQVGSCIALVIKTKQAMVKEFFIFEASSMPKRRADEFYVEENIGMSRSRWRSRKSANCIWTQKFSRSGMLEILL